MPSVAILGAGIAGLTAAYRLQQRGLTPLVFEAGAEPGGKIRTERTEGYLVEHGPNSLQATSPRLQALIDDLGLGPQQVTAAEAARHRFVVRDGRPVALPGSPPAFFTSSLFSLRTKLRLLREPFVPPAEADAEESVAAFVRRRLGPELLDYAINPFVAGIYAGDPERLSVRHAFPRLHALEQTYGSLIKGQVKKKKADRRGGATGPSARIFSFQDGLQTLPRALADHLGDALHLRTRVVAMEPRGDGWTVTAERDGESTQHAVEAVCSTLPLHQLPSLRLPFDPASLAKVTYAPVTVLALGFPRSAIDHPLDGFGVLVPAVEDGLQVLGCLFSSTLFPGRAPEDHVLLTCFVGGMRHPEWTQVSDSALRAVVLRDLGRLLGAHGRPAFTQRIDWPRAIPQYLLGYGAVKDRLDALEAQHPRLAFAGNYRQGISVGDALTSGYDAAERLAQRIAEPAQS